MAFIKFVRAADKEEILVNTRLIRAVERDVVGKKAEQQSRLIFVDKSAEVTVVGNIGQIAGWLSTS